MAIPSSGILRISGCSQACGSIMKAVAAANTVPQNLLKLGADGCMARPVCMSDFYSFVGPAGGHTVGYSNISASGCLGTTARCSLDCICSNVASVAGQCYCITLCNNLCVNNSAGSCSIACAIYDGASLYSCSLTGIVGGTASFSCTFVVCGGCTFCLWLCASHPGAPGVCSSCAQIYISNISCLTPTYGIFTRAATYCCCVYSCA